MDRHHFLAEGYRQLNNPQHYKRIPQPVHTTIKPRLIEILRKMKYELIITDKELNFLLPPTKPRDRRFYMLLKTHKPLESWTIPNKMPPGRPIVSDCNLVIAYLKTLLDS